VRRRLYQRRPTVQAGLGLCLQRLKRILNSSAIDVRSLTTRLAGTAVCCRQVVIMGD
jgi:hypothetical protein